MGKREPLALVEYAPAIFAAEVLTEEEARQLDVRFPKIIEIDPPTYKTNQCWRLTSRGWIGQLRLDTGLTLVSRPKVPVTNVYRMIEYAYDLEPRFPSGASKAAEIEEFFELLAARLASQVLRRARQGLY